MASIEESDVRALALDIRDTGKFRQAQKVLGLVTATLDDAVLEKLITRNVAKDVPRKLLRGGDRVKNFAAIDSPVEFGHLLRAIDGYGGNVVTRYALQFSALTFQRPGEVRGARWEEFENLDDESTALWRIPAERMKVRQQHLVALAPKTVRLLRELREITGDGRFLFPCPTDPHKRMSENCIRLAIKAAKPATPTVVHATVQATA
jgi:integrase